MTRWIHIFRLTLALVGAVLASQTASAQVPAAGTRIVNQAVVNYTDETGANRQATTNEVVLFVQQVYSGTLTNDETRFAVIGGQVVFPHVLRNTGNGTDAFCVRAADKTGDDGNYDLLEVIHDTDGDGEIDVSNTVLFVSSDTADGRIALGAGQSANILVRGRLPSSAAADENYDAQLIVSSAGAAGTCGSAQVNDIGTDGDNTDGTNDDRAVITSDAILEIYKSSTYDAGAAADLSDDQISYALTVRNVGASAAADILLTDTLPSDVTFESFGTHDGVFAAGPTFLAGDVSAQVAALPIGDEVVVRFTVDVNPALGFDGAERVIENTAQVDGDVDGTPGRDGPVQSNTVRDDVSQAYGVILSDIGGPASLGVNDGRDDDGVVNDNQHVDVASLGEAVTFQMRVTNTGNVTDSYNLVPNTRFGWFTGAGIRYLNRDFATPLLDTTGDGISDTGPIAPGETFTFVIEAVMPFNEPAAPHRLTLEAKSTAVRDDGLANVEDDSQISIGSASTAGVDIANSIAAAGYNDGGAVDAHPASAVTTSNTIGPGESTSFDLFIANEGAGPDTFSLTFAGSADGTVPLSSGWQVKFTDISGEEISKTSLMNAGESFAFKAVVTSPKTAENQAAQSVYFITESFETGVSDVKQDEVTIGIAPYITLTPDRTGQVGTCGFKEYVHVLRNAGGTPEDVALSISAQTKLTSQLWLPTATDGSGPTDFEMAVFLSVGDDVVILEGGTWKTVALVTDGAGGVAIPLSVGDETRAKVRVMASCDTAEGTVDILTLLAESVDADTESRATDKTTVSNAQLSITKYGALDALCDGTADGGFEDANVKAGPGECVIWEINLENASTDPVCDVRSRDAAPSFTQFSGAPLIRFQPSPGTGSCTVNGSEFSCTVGNSMDIDGDASDEAFCLRGGDKAQIHFAVKID